VNWFEKAILPEKLPPQTDSKQDIYSLKQFLAQALSKQSKSPRTLAGVDLSTDQRLDETSLVTSLRHQKRYYSIEKCFAVSHAKNQ